MRDHTQAAPTGYTEHHRSNQRQSDSERLMEAVERHVKALRPALDTVRQEAAITRAFLEALGANSSTLEAILAGNDLAYREWVELRSRRAVDDTTRVSGEPTTTAELVTS